MKEMPAGQQMALLDRFSVQRGRLERSFSKVMHQLQHLRAKQNVATSPQPLAPKGTRPLAPSDAWLQPVSPLIMAPEHTQLAT